jgi:tetratricopeptide (TPR) repeat protein
MREGLENAVKRGVRPRDALRRLVRLFQEQDNLGAAIETFEKYLSYNSGSNTSGDFFTLGTLSLQHGSYAKSVEAFVQSLAAADNREAALKQIYRHFKSLEQFTRFLSFVKHLEDTGMAVPGIDMVKVKCYFDMDQLFLAKQLLEPMITYKPTGPALFLRAAIAQKERDWDTMEIYSQRATRLDPYKPEYHFLFAQALNTRKKYANAEHAVTQAIRHASRENSGYYNFRAWTRWHQEKYKQAALDWEKAAALDPENPTFAERAREARERIGLSPVTGN